jgi:hypothetical protein
MQARTVLPSPLLPASSSAILCIDHSDSRHTSQRLCTSCKCWPPALAAGANTHNTWYSLVAVSWQGRRAITSSQHQHLFCSLQEPGAPPSRTPHCAHTCKPCLQPSPTHDTTPGPAPLLSDQPNSPVTSHCAHQRGARISYHQHSTYWRPCGCLARCCCCCWCVHTCCGEWRKSSSSWAPLMQWTTPSTPARS